MQVTRLIVATPETQQVTDWFASSGIQVGPSSKSVMRPLPEIMMAMADGVVDSGHSAALGFQPTRGDLTVLRIFGNDLGDITSCAAAYARKYGKVVSARQKQHGPDPDLLLGLYEKVEDGKATLPDASAGTPSFSQSISHFASNLVSRNLSSERNEGSQPPIPSITGNILIVHSNSCMQALWAAILKERGSHRVQRVATGLEALNLMERDHFDLVLTHLRLTDMCPFLLINTVKRRKDSHDTRFAVLTNCRNDRARQLSIALGADGYRAPPQGVREMQAYIGELLNSEPTPGDPPRAIVLLHEFGRELARSASSFQREDPHIFRGSVCDASESSDSLLDLPPGIAPWQAVECLLFQLKELGRELSRISGADEILDPWYWILQGGAGTPD